MVIKEILWDPTETVATRPLAIQKDGTWFTFGWDITKNIWELFGPAGYIRTTYSYEPFGNVSMNASGVVQPFRFSSEFYDEELDLVYYNYRHYSPSLGRFLSRDPIEEQGGLNLYAFVENNPIVKFDVAGRKCSHSEHRIRNGKREGRTTPSKNGCGSEGSECVPDSFLWLVNFKPACDKHDICYGTCGANKTQCDATLGIDMTNACLKAFGFLALFPFGGMKTLLALCLAQTEIYVATLLVIGEADRAFKRAQEEACWEECPCYEAKK